jgi:AcrR family transcriptional regulator
MVEVCVERGPANVSVAHVVERAGVSRRTFYEIFGGREDCFLAAFDDGVARAFRYVLDAYDPAVRWVERIGIALTALLSFLDAERDVAWVLVVGSAGAGPEVLERRRRAISQMVTAVDEGRLERRAGEHLPPLTAEGVVGGALSVLHSRLSEADPGRLVELTGPLMSMIVLPYLGAAAARRELTRPMLQRPRADRRVMGDPLRDLGMRLTYRTVRVLLSVAAAPGSSNREIGLAAGISDQGQISKLLSRLQGLGLVQNTGLAPGKGAPNSWMLTAKGTRVERAMSIDAGSQEPAGSVSANHGNDDEVGVADED